MATCETHGHLWGPGEKCVMCKTPKPAELPPSKDVSSERLAELIEDRQRFVSYLEAGGGDPDLDDALNMARDLVTALQKLQRAENEPPAAQSAELAALKKYHAEIVECDGAECEAMRLTRWAIETIERTSQPPPVVQDMEKIAWCQKVHEDLAVYVDDGGGQMIHVRAKRALGIMFDEMQKLEEALYPSLKKEGP